jgi:hypothetical protein
MLMLFQDDVDFVIGCDADVDNETILMLVNLRF